MSHGAAGFAYALASLAQATGRQELRQEFAQAAAECIAFENSSYDAERHNWPDLREQGGLSWQTPSRRRHDVYVHVADQQVLNQRIEQLLPLDANGAK